MTIQERRVHERFELNEEALVDFGSGEVRVKLIDISIGGARVGIPAFISSTVTEQTGKIIVPDGGEHGFRIQWRTQSEIGLAFTQPVGASAALRKKLQALGEAHT